MPEAHVIPPGLDLGRSRPCRRPTRPRPLVVHAPSNREKKGTRCVIEACAELPVELDIVEGVPHDVARERYARADIVVDQLNAGWHGVFALEAMALGKPVVTYLKPDVGRPQRGGLRHPPPGRAGDCGDPGRRSRRSSNSRRCDGRSGAEARLRRAGARQHRVADRCVDLYVLTPPSGPMSLSFEIRRLGRHSAIYGLGGISRGSSRPSSCRSTPRTSPPKAYGKIEIVTAPSTVLAIVLEAGIASAFFRFYFDSKDPSAANSSSEPRSGSRWACRRSDSCSASCSRPARPSLELGDYPSLVRAGTRAGPDRRERAEEVADDRTRRALVETDDEQNGHRRP